MTTNQIAYQNMIENRRHNQVEERLTSQRDAANRAIGISNSVASHGKNITKLLSFGR